MELKDITIGKEYYVLDKKNGRGVIRRCITKQTMKGERTTIIVLSRINGGFNGLDDLIVSINSVFKTEKDAQIEQQRIELI